ncbi:30S ribosomal protein S4 [Propionivibrio sp.]|uniref:30S ribosomal protein S4 n=1 Tax=Propionivibrio sp. TaxID=2212460 RepID=UPI00272E5567|nr:30S ribosomal protein S4 [Propionivibrio sp.]
MSRYTGPRRKILRALGIDLPGLSRHTIEGNPNPPGQHGYQKANRKRSEFGLQLMEKQKLRYNYGVSEKQLRRIVEDAKRQRGATGDRIVALLERRLDNLVFRAGFAPTIPAARQMISHGHILLNGRRVTIPSIRVRAGDVFGPTEGGKKLDLLQATLKEPALERPDWIAFDATVQSARLSFLPEGVDAAPFPLDVHRIVEYYATRI